MAASRAALKSIKAAIDANDFASASEKAAEFVRHDSQNHTALLFLGFAREKLDEDEKAESAYEAAARAKPGDPQPLKGLISLYEKQGQKSIDKYHAIAVQLAQIYGSLDDQTQCQNVIDRYESSRKAWVKIAVQTCPRTSFAIQHFVFFS